MSVRNEPLSTSVNWYKPAAVVAWVFGTYFTYLFFAQIAPEAFWLSALLLSIVVQFLFTLAERPLWKRAFNRSGGKYAPIGVVVTIIDGAFNAGGIYGFIPRIVETDTGRMIVNAFGISSNTGALAHLIIAMTLGIAAAGLAEYLWECE